LTQKRASHHEKDFTARSGDAVIEHGSSPATLDYAYMMECAAEVFGHQPHGNLARYCSAWRWSSCEFTTDAATGASSARPRLRVKQREII